jgi:hypothetical protein
MAKEVACKSSTHLDEAIPVTEETRATGFRFNKNLVTA